MMKHRLWILLAISLCGLVACRPTNNDPLPTLARLPTQTEIAAPVVVQLAQNTLPATFTPTFTPTHTATHTPSATLPVSGTPTLTPSQTITNTPTPTVTPLPTIPADQRPALGLAQLLRNATVLPQNFQVPAYQGIDIALTTPTPAPATNIEGAILIPPPNATANSVVVTASPVPNQGVPTATATQQACTIAAGGGFASLLESNTALATRLGCPNAAPQSVAAAWQGFQNGTMVWLNGEILVFYTVGGTYSRFSDTFAEGTDPETSSETPPPNLYAPRRGFLKVWANNPDVKNGLGWAIMTEQGVTATVQTFSNGRMIYLPGRNDIIVMIGSTWETFGGSY